VALTLALARKLDELRVVKDRRFMEEIRKLLQGDPRRKTISSLLSSLDIAVRKIAIS
jgi:hypothetical protein